MLIKTKIFKNYYFCTLFCIFFTGNLNADICDNLGLNLIINGDFSKGNIDFYSDYYFAANPPINQGYYAIAAKPKDYHPGFANCSDRSASDDNLMFFTDASSNTNLILWQQTCNVLPNSKYKFKLSATKMVFMLDPIVTIYINDVLIKSFNVTEYSCTWMDFNFTWESKNSSTAKITIKSTNPEVSGNDFALDDIGFFQCFCNTLGDELIENGTLDSIKIDVKSDYPIVIDNIIPAPGFISFSDDHSVFKLAGCTDNINKSGYEFIVNNHKTNDKAIVIFSKDVIIGEEYILSFDALHFSGIMTNEFIVEINNKNVGSFLFENQKCNWETFKLSWIADDIIANFKIISNNKSDNEMIFALDNFSIKSCSCTPPSFNEFPDTTICFGGKMQIGYTANNEYQYKWLNSQDISDVNVSNPTIFPKNNCKYILQITTKNGCVAYDTVNVEVSPKQDIDILGKQTICFGESEILNAGSDMAEYQWSTGEKTKSITVNQAGTYILTAKDANGCIYEGEFSVTVQPEINFSVNGNFVLCDNEIGNLNVVENFKEYLWSDGSKTKEITINSAGKYWVKVTDENGCTATKEIQVDNTGLNILYPDSLDFGKICMYSEGSIASYLKNLNNVNIVAYTIYFTQETEEFSVIYNDTLPQTVLPNNLLPFTVNFAPKTEKIHHDTLIIVISEPCPTVIKIPIFAEGLKSSAEIFVIDTIVLVNTELCIPISGRMTCALPQTLISEYEIEVVFNKKLFLPQNVLNGEIISNRIEGVKRIVRIRQDSVHLEADTTHLTYLCGIIMLSDSIVNVVDISDFDWKNNLIEYRIYPGKVTVQHCVLPLRQIQIIENFKLTIKPNPSTDFIEVTSILKDKTYSAEIIDMLGVVLSITEISDKHNKINIANLSEGTYFIRIDGQLIKFIKN